MSQTHLIRAFLEIHKNVNERLLEHLLERIVQQFQFSLREDIILYDDFAGTKIYLMKGPEERYAELKKVGERLGCKITEITSPETSQQYFADVFFDDFISDDYAHL